VGSNGSNGTSMFPSQFNEAVDTEDATENEIVRILHEQAAQAPPVDLALRDYDVPPGEIPSSRQPASTSAPITNTELDNTLLAAECSDSRLPSPEEREQESLTAPGTSTGGGNGNSSPLLSPLPNDIGF
jgi:hypothetical protein